MTTFQLSGRGPFPPALAPFLAPMYYRLVFSGNPFSHAASSLPVRQYSVSTDPAFVANGMYLSRLLHQPRARHWVCLLVVSCMATSAAFAGRLRHSSFTGARTCRLESLPAHVVTQQTQVAGMTAYGQW